MSLRILVVDDEKISRVTTVKQLNASGFEAQSHETPFSALHAFDEGHWDVVLTDLRMPGMDGLQFLKEIKNQSPETEVILMTAYGTVATAVDAMRKGAADYLTKPFDFEELKVRLERISNHMDIRREVATLRKAMGSTLSFCGLIGGSKAMRDTFDLIERFTDNPANVLITGETGTGKELVARALHTQSPRSKGPFVALGCGAVPRELAESELFGHEAGSFTGATKRRRGRFEMARGGTLFLDDVDDLPLEIQAKLLRAIQERQFERVGGETTLTADVRILAATKKDLVKQIQENLFREDLMYRLKVLEIRIPPLRERREDILLLAQHFLTRSGNASASPKNLTTEASEHLLAYHWPGNVRELQHAIEHGVAFSRTEFVSPEDLPDTLKSTSHATKEASFQLDLDALEHLKFRPYMEMIEQKIIHWALRKTQGHQGKAAELLGIPRTTLQSKISNNVQDPKIEDSRNELKED